MRASGASRNLLEYLQRLYPPREGEVLGDGAAVAGVELDSEAGEPLLDYLLGPSGGSR